jgi:hypothetical protein
LPKAFNPGVSAFIRYRTEEIKPGHNTGYEKKFESSSFDNELFHLQVFHNTEESNITTTLRIALKQSIAVELFYVTLTMPKQGKCVVLDRFYKLCEIKHSIWNNNLTPLFLQYSDGDSSLLLYSGDKMFSHKITDNGDNIDLTIYIDAAAQHPKWSYRTSEKLSSASELLPVGQEYDLNFSSLSLKKEATAIPVVSRYPFGHEAAFLLTDHSDYDDTERLSVFLNGNGAGEGWKNKKLKITKGVFTLKSTRPGAKKAATLEDEKYKSLISELLHDGSEIVPHALNQSGQIDKAVYEKAINTLHDAFSPKTWIDHGSYLKYCYSAGGSENPDYRLLETLKQKNYNAIWSCFDVPAASYLGLNQFNLKQNGEKRTLLKIVTTKLLNGQPAVAAHNFKSFLERKNKEQGAVATLLKLISASRIYFQRGKTTFSNIRQSKKYLPYTEEEIKNFSPVISAEKLPLHSASNGDLLFFSTQEAVQIDETYKPATLDKLIREKGLHIGHTYILNKLPYINGIFAKGKQNTIAGYWTNFTSYLSDKVKEGIVWNPNMSDFVDHIRDLQSIKLSYTSEKSLILVNSSSHDIEGLSFVFLACKEKPKHISWNGNPATNRTDKTTGDIFFWGNIPANGKAILEWQ